MRRRKNSESSDDEGKASDNQTQRADGRVAPDLSATDATDSRAEPFAVLPLAVEERGPGGEVAVRPFDPNATHRVWHAAGPGKVSFAREQRRGPPEVERLLWARLRGRQLGPKFRRQHPIGDFILDFYCEAARLAVEIDGPHHTQQPNFDAWRDGQLAALGIRVLRVSAAEASSNTDAVVARIALEAQAPASTDDDPRAT